MTSSGFGYSSGRGGGQDDRQKEHIRTSLNQPVQKQQASDQQRSRAGTSAIIRNIRFNQLRSQGVGPIEALRLIGIRLPIEKSARMNPTELKRIVETGDIGKRPL